MLYPRCWRWARTDRGEPALRLHLKRPDVAQNTSRDNEAALIVTLSSVCFTR
jgi:hypothetical protein